MKNLSKLPIPLLEWYRDNARDLPWRRSRDPYSVWVSEIMLQQTRVAAVLDYYARFMEALPTVESLARVPEDRLLKLWQGLGYYSRARNLHKAAGVIFTDFDGAFPTKYKDIRALPGIGDYTAAAIGSICFDLPLPAVDGNLLRICARIAADGDDITTLAMKNKVRHALERIIPIRQPGAFNQAMMDLGATVCLPNGTPLCHLCPAAAFCAARKDDRIGSLPFRSAKKPRRIEERQVFLIFHQGHVALRRRSPQGLLAGLWEYPSAASTQSPPLPEWLSALPTFPDAAGRHIFTHVEWHMQAYVIKAPDKTLPEGWVWADTEALANTYALPSAFTPFQKLVAHHLISP